MRNTIEFAAAWRFACRVLQIQERKENAKRMKPVYQKDLQAILEEEPRLRTVSS